MRQGETVGEGDESVVNSEPAALQHFSATAAGQLQKVAAVRPLKSPGGAGRRAGGCRRTPRRARVAAAAAAGAVARNAAWQRGPVACPDAGAAGGLGSGAGSPLAGVAFAMTASATTASAVAALALRRPTFARLAGRGFAHPGNRGADQPLNRGHRLAVGWRYDGDGDPGQAGAAGQGFPRAPLTRWSAMPAGIGSMNGVWRGRNAGGPVGGRSDVT